LCSNVEEFLKLLKWEFYGTYEILSRDYLAWDTLSAVRAVWVTIQRKGLGEELGEEEEEEPLPIPSDWKVGHLILFKKQPEACDL